MITEGLKQDKAGEHPPVPEALEGSANPNGCFENLSQRWTLSPQNRFANLKAGTRFTPSSGSVPP